METATLTIDLDALVASVRKFATERPDYVYAETPRAECNYMHGDVPGCIIGHAFIDLGFEPEQVVQFDVDDPDPNFQGTGIPEILQRHFGMDDGDAWFDPRAAWLRAVQSRQDTGWTWAAAVVYADGTCPLSK